MIPAILAGIYTAMAKWKTSFWKSPENYGEEDYNRIIAETSSWPVMYHFSNIRQNIVEWLPIGKGDCVLEIGAGCGAITGALARKAKKCALY